MGYSGGVMGSDFFGGLALDISSLVESIFASGIFM
jgi:hypothetical protein